MKIHIGSILYHRYANLTELNTLLTHIQSHTLTLLSSSPACDWHKTCQKYTENHFSTHSFLATAFLNIYTTFLTLRAHFRALSTLTHTNIEPPTSTYICDETMRNKGVLMCGVPGAGGFDAIFAVVIGEENVKEVEKTWREMSERGEKGNEVKIERLPVSVQRKEEAGVQIAKVNVDVDSWSLHA